MSGSVVRGTECAGSSNGGGDTAGNRKAVWAGKYNKRPEGVQPEHWWNYV